MTHEIFQNITCFEHKGMFSLEMHDHGSKIDTRLLSGGEYIDIIIKMAKLIVKDDALREKLFAGIHEGYCPRCFQPMKERCWGCYESPNYGDG